MTDLASAIEPFATSLLRASWQASLLAILILLLQRLLGRRISARARYALWSLVLLRLALPVSIPTPISWHNYVPRPTQTVHVVTVPQHPLPVTVSVDLPLPQATPVPPRTPSLTWRHVLTLTWAAGCGASLLLIAVATLRLSLQIRRLTPVTDDRILFLLRSAAADLHLRGRFPTLLTGPRAPGPALVGFLRPRLLLPSSVLSFDDASLRLILLHELAHHQRLDVPANWLLAVLQAAHWFNPFVHLAFARVRADRELACDERVLSLSSTSSDRPAYGRTIVRLVESLSGAPKVPAPAVGILQGRHQLRRRITMIAEHRPTRRAWSLTALALGSLLAVVACTDAVRGQDKKPKVNVNVDVKPAAPAEGAARGDNGFGANPYVAVVAPDMGTEGSPPGFAQPQPLDARLAKRLPQLKFEDIPLIDALNFVRDAAQINLFIDRRALQAAEVDLDTPISLDLKDISVDQAFRLIGRSAATPGVELAATADNDVIVFGVGAQRHRPVTPVAGPEVPMGMVPGGEGGMMGGSPYGGGFAPVTPRRGAAAEKAITRVYDVAALCGNDDSKLNTLVQVVMTSMNVTQSSALVSIAPFNGKLVVAATPDVQDQVAQLLTMLKDSAPATQPAIQPTRTSGF